MIKEAKSNEMLAVVTATEFALTTEKLEEIKKLFYPLAERIKEFIGPIEDLASKEITEENMDKLGSQAKRLRLDIAKIRTDAGKVKDTEKAGILKLGSAIQKCYNLIKDVAEEQEEKMESIEKYAENIKREQMQKLQKEREKMLLEYEVENSQTMKLGEMDEGLFNNFLLGCKMNFEAKKQKEKEENEAREKLKKEENDRQKKLQEDNEKLKKEAEGNKKKQDEENEKRRKEMKEIERKNALVTDENNRLKKEKEDQEKKLEQERLDKIEKEKQDLISQKKLEKEKSYKDFLKRNEGKFDEIQKDEEKRTITLIKIIEVFYY